MAKYSFCQKKRQHFLKRRSGFHIPVRLAFGKCQLIMSLTTSSLHLIGAQSRVQAGWADCQPGVTGRNWFLSQGMWGLNEVKGEPVALKEREVLHMFFPVSLKWLLGVNKFRLPRWLRCKESSCSVGDPGDTSSIPRSGGSPRGGHGNPLQYSCLENPMDRGDWQATVHRVAKSQTWPSTHIHTSKFSKGSWMQWMNDRLGMQSRTEVRGEKGRLGGWGTWPGLGA